MNERIGELYTQALEYADSKVPPERRYNDIYYAIVSGKHAELIVRECAQLARDTNLEDVEGGDNDVLRAAKQQILEHFGVEE
jgi:hypothetical protein